MIVTLLTIACCCGVPFYYGKPVWDQYPASAAPPEAVADLTLRDDKQSQQIIQELKTETRTEYLIAEETFAAVYADSNGKRVMIFGTTGFRLNPEDDVNAEIARLTDQYDLTDVQPIETGVRGQYQSCATGRADGTGIVLCTWADHGSLGTALFTRRSMTDSTALLPQLRDSIITRE